ncbi:sigma-54-dependent transcriptional regulator [Desulfovibrio sp. TomC]|uniref:sigma-54-dependent transcriptional regulator n=1 Tax=Desulfovibrio sp. TomC TaxID=1562888 RepID=UPI000575BBDF|nr:sigma-54 dependent transcriptional regulator [Desulfovibrio sp. TomC]KHK02265.1 sigma-54 dependent transcriptional regulator/response regulator [Desulfovibrio sp. TomC]
MPARILVIDDDAAFRDMLCEALLSRDFDPVGVGSAEEGVARAKAEAFDLVLTDVMLPGMDGIEGLSKIKEAAPESEVIVMTGYSAREKALDAVRLGAYDFFAKPFSLAEMEVVLRRALERRTLLAELRQLKSVMASGRGPIIVGQSPPMRAVVDMVRRVAPLDSTVLITGESGSGKEVVADAIQALSKRATAPFVKVNCAAIPENLLESELFGHEKGAFTGAVALKKGKFELANQGTIMLDEIGDMPLFLQPKLLRAVEQKQIERVGGAKPIDIDIRIIAATNQDLQNLVAQKLFRADLYYRLSVAAVPLPPLRERKEDLPLLVGHFLERIGPRVGVNLRGVSREGMQLLFDYDWPGNVRQLANLLERAAIMSSGEVLTAVEIGRALDRPTRLVPEDAGPDDLPEAAGNLRDTLQDMERNMILTALKKAGGSQKDAARSLGVSPKNLWNKIQKHRIDPTEYSA